MMADARIAHLHSDHSILINGLLLVIDINLYLSPGFCMVKGIMMPNQARWGCVWYPLPGIHRSRAEYHKPDLIRRVPTDLIEGKAISLKTS
jgi:hypothetical protein